MIPDHIAVTYCRCCEYRIMEHGQCLMGCRYDGTTDRQRPIILVTYWQRDPPNRTE